MKEKYIPRESKTEIRTLFCWEGDGSKAKLKEAREYFGHTNLKADEDGNLIQGVQIYMKPGQWAWKQGNFVVMNLNLGDYKKAWFFTREDRSSFPYWFAHFLAFNLTAILFRGWKFKYLFHDAEKPWLKLFVKDYKKLQTWHRTHNRHHLEYGLARGWDKMDWEALVIDWECSKLSKMGAQLDARDTLEYELTKDKWKPYEKEIRAGIEPVLEKLWL